MNGIRGLHRRADKRSRTGVLGVSYSEIRIHGRKRVPHFTANTASGSRSFNIRRLGRDEAFRRALKIRAAYERNRREVAS
jgi:hypothetical protein